MMSNECALPRNRHLTHRPVLLQKRIKGEDLATVDVVQICGELQRPVPSYILYCEKKREGMWNFLKKDSLGLIPHPYCRSNLEKGGYQNFKKNNSISPILHKVPKQVDTSSNNCRIGKVSDYSLVNLPSLESFDVFSVQDLNPNEWLLKKPRALAAAYDGVSWQWVPIDIESFDCAAQKFCISFLDKERFGYKRKLLSRLNILFEIEDKNVWEMRRTKAVAARNLYKMFLRLEGMVRRQPDTDIRPIPHKFMMSIISKVKSNCVIYTNYLDLLTEEIEDLYIHAMKNSIVKYQYLTSTHFFSGLSFSENHPFYALPTEQEKLEATSHLLIHKKNSINHIHLFSSWEIYNTFHWLHKTWIDNFSETCMFHLPINKVWNLENFIKHQALHCSTIRNKLELEWRQSYLGKILDELSNIYDFYHEHIPGYNSSNLARFFRLSDFVMAQQLRSICLNNLKLFQEYIVQSVNTCDFRQIFTVSAILVNGECFVNPSRDEIQNSLINCIDNFLEQLCALQSIDVDVMGNPSSCRTILDFRNRPTLFEECKAKIDECKTILLNSVEKAFDQVDRFIAEKLKVYAVNDTSMGDEIEEWFSNVVDSKKSETKNIVDRTQIMYKRMISKATSFDELHKSISTISRFNDVIMIRIDTSLMKEELLSKALFQRDKLLEMIIEDINLDCKKINDKYEKIIEDLSVCPHDEKGWEQLRFLVSTYNKKVDVLVSHTSQLMNRLNAVEILSFRVKYLEMFWGLHSFPRKIQKAVEGASKVLRLKRFRQTEILNEDRDTFEGSNSLFQVSLDDCRRLENCSNMEPNAKSFDNVTYKCRKESKEDK